MKSENSYYRINPFARFRWSSLPYESEDLSSVAYTSKDAEEGQRVTNPKLFHVLNSVTGGISHDELKGEIRTKLGVNDDVATNTLNLLLERKFIVPSNADLFDRAQEWYDKKWHHALFFHAATRNVDHVEESDNGGDEVRSVLTNFREEGDSPSLTSRISGREVTLPDPDQLPDKPLTEVLMDRSTSRSFSGSVSSTTISTLLYYTSKTAKAHREYIQNNLNDPVRRVVSSYVAHDIFPIVLKGEDITNGVYHYNSEDHSLTAIKEGSFEEEIVNIAIGQEWVGEAAVVFLFVTDFERYQWQYRHSDELRNLFVDVSALAHRLILAATALDKRNFLTPAMRDDRVESFLNLTPPQKGATYLVAIGEE